MQVCADMSALSLHKTCGTPTRCPALPLSRVSGAAGKDDGGCMERNNQQMADLWYSEFHADDVKFSIRVGRQLCSEQTPFQRIEFFESETFGTFFTIDGLMMVTQKDEFAYHEMITHVPFAVNPDIRRVLIIGGGDGGTAREVCRYKGVEYIDLVDIDERVVRLCQQYLPQTACVLDRDPRLHLHFEDGLAFVRRAPKAGYDLIIVDSTDPVGPGEGLFTMEFYKSCADALADGGILINQHESPYYEHYAHEMLRAHKKLRETFPVAKVYQFHMPTYPSGHWLFGFASKKLDPVRDFQRGRWEALGLETRYYNTDLHCAAFALPTYVKELLEYDG
jgi:spermidine synthase